jgi:hypothetical protein
VRGVRRLAADGRLIYDTFTGTGAIGSHTPEICPAGSAWSVKNGAFSDLASGQVPYNTGHWGVAIINAGAADVDIECVLTPADYAAGNVGVIIRSAADGATRYLVTLNPGDGRLAMHYHTAMQTGGAPTVAYTRSGLFGLTEVTLRVVMKGGECRIAINGEFVAWFEDTHLTDTYVGIGCYYGNASGMKWNTVTVGPVGAQAYITVIGDSISNPALTSYPRWCRSVMWNYDTTKWVDYQNHSTSSYNIVAHMAELVAASAADTPNKIFIALGTNDTDTGSVETVYAAQLQRLWVDHPGVPIYCLNILPRATPPDNGGVNNPRIAAAVATALAAGVNVTLWDTRSPTPWINTSSDLEDGLHPSEAGSYKIALEVLARI